MSAGARGIVVQDGTPKGRVALVPVDGVLTCGRNSSMSEFLCKDPHVSRRHCALRAEGDGRLRVRDLGSSSGTFVNGKRLNPETLTGPGSTIRLGKSFCLVVVGLVGTHAPEGILGEPRVPHWLTPGYLLLREVGRGGMGVVYEAYDWNRQERCAVKWLAPGAKANADIQERFRREAELQHTLKDYPGIVTLNDLGVVPGSGELFCTMEFVEGETLHKRFKSKALGLLEGVKLVSRVVRAVDYAHQHGIVHRDLKPANVLITQQGTIRLTDFGIAKLCVDGEGGGLTATGVMMGTPGYMAPEQINDSASAGPASDIYGLGAILYHHLCGGPPVKGKGLREVLESVDRGTFAPPRQVDPQIDVDLERICMRALARLPAERWPSAHEFAHALEDWLKERDPVEPVKLRPPSGH